MIDRLSSSGTETSLRELLPALQAPDLAHGIAVLWSDRNHLAQVREMGLPCYVPTEVLGSRVARIQHVRRAVRDFQPDLLHTSLFESDLVGRVAGVVTRTPVLTSLVNMPYIAEARPLGRFARLKHRGVRWLDGMLGRHATFAFHAVTEAVADVAVADLGLDRDRIFIVRRGRRQDRLGELSPERRVRVRSALGIDPDAPVILAVGRQEPQKNHVTLIAAASQLREAFPRAIVMVAGREGRSTPRIVELIEGAGVEDAVRLLGHRDDVGDLLAAADVFAFPSAYEGASGAALEAMALGVPIIASDIVSLRELLDGGRLGMLVDPNEPSLWAEGLITVLFDPQTAQARAEAARARFVTAHTLEASAEEMQEMYRRIGRRVDASRVRTPTSQPNGSRRRRGR